MIVEYYPSASVFAEICNRIEIEGEHVKFWADNDRVWKYDKVLFSYVYQGKVDPRRKFNIRPDVKIMGDSGGFQVSTKGVSVEPTGVLSWLETYCDIGFSLDVPESKNTSFEKSFSVTKKFVEVFAKNRDPDSKCELLNVIHGGKPDDFNFWLREMEPYQHAFQGYAVTNSVLATKQAGFTTTLYQVGKMLELKPKRLHVLALSGFEMVPSIFLLARENPDVQFSTDSSTWSLLGKFRRMWLDGGFKVDFGTKEGYPDISEVPCRCPICSKVSTSQLVSKSGFGSCIISAHNLWYTVEFLNMINALSTSYEALLDYTKQRSKKGYEWLLAARALIDTDAETFREKYVDKGMSEFE